jgi:membrane fusion protein (multidrug efflux system)
MSQSAVLEDPANGKSDAIERRAVHETGATPVKEAAAGAASRALKGRSAKRRLRLLLLLALGLVAGAWGLRVVHHLLTHTETDDAYVTGSIHAVNSRIPGVVEQILVEENALVTTGQPLIKLETRDLDLRCEQARAAVQQARAALVQAESKIPVVIAQGELSKAGIEMAQANVSRDEANVAKAAHDLERATKMFRPGAGGAISQAELDAAQTAARTSNATLSATRATLAAAEAYWATAEAKEKSARAEIDAAGAQCKTAEINQRDAELQRSYCTIVAPSSGRVSRRAVEVGNRIQPGQSLFALVDPAVWIQANFKETQLAGLRVGSPVDIQVDALPGRELHGRIESFSPASGAQFALLPPDNATGNFTKVVQRVPVKILFDVDSIRGLEDQIRPGLSTTVSVPR